MDRFVRPDNFGNDLVAFVTSLVLVAAYYLWLARKVRRDPTYTVHAINELARTAWVASVMKNPARDVMAVQTLRNFIMGASLMASTATLLIIGTLTLSGQADNIARSWHALNLGGTHAAQLWIFKVLCLLADFIVAFFAFAMAVRLANHVVFMVNIPGIDADGTDTRGDAQGRLSAAAVARRLNRAGNLFAVGMRAFFFAVPLVFWLFGPLFLVIATVGLIATLRRLDRSDP